MKIELLHITPDAEKLCEKAARICYQSQDKMSEDSYKTFIPKIIKKHHESILEHATATFRISGISRSSSHQLVRHRLASYSQKSQRYVDEKEFEYVTPPSIENAEPIVKETYHQYMKDVQEFYEFFSGVCNKEDARFVLPNACTTELVMTANFREWRHIIKLRCHSAAQWEVQTLALLILAILYDSAPSVFGDLAEEFLTSFDKIGE